MTVLPCGIQDSSTVAARMNSQQAYRPLAAVYSSWTITLPIQRDIIQRPTHTEGQQKGQKSTLVTDCKHRKGTLTSRQLIAYLAGWDRLNLLVTESHTWRLPAERSEQEFTQINTKIYHDYINSDLINFSVWSTLRWKLGGRWYGWKPTGPPCCRMAWWAAWRPSLRPGIRLLLRCPGRLFGWFSSSSWSPKRYEWRSLKEINYFTTLFVK